MLSLVHLCDSSGRILVGRDYRGEVGSLRVKSFCEERLRRSTGDSPPIEQFDGSTFFTRRLHGLVLLGATSSDVNAAAATEILVALGNVFLAFGIVEHGVAPSPSAVQAKAPLILALLDECLDNGVPQNLDPAMLRNVILVEGATAGPGPVTERQASLPGAVTTRSLTSATPWRPHGVRHTQPSQVLIDVVERVSVTLSSAGAAMSGEVHGVARLTCRMSGMPSCHIAFNEAVPLAGAIFHQCVRLEQFAQRGEITFTPPEGAFDLMTWRQTEDVRPPLRVTTSLTRRGRTRSELVVLVRASFPKELTAFDVRVRIPLPALTSGVVSRLGGAQGTAKWRRSEKVLLWKVRELAGGGDASLALEISTASRTHEEESGRLVPLTLCFNVPQLTATGMRVRFLRVATPDAPVSKFIRYTVCAGTYEVRVPA